MKMIFSNKKIIIPAVIIQVPKQPIQINKNINILNGGMVNRIMPNNANCTECGK